MMTFLAPILGDAGAIVCAVLLRIVWLAAELILAGVFYGWILLKRKPVV